MYLLYHLIRLYNDGDRSDLIEYAFRMYNFAGANSGEAFIDAGGESWDADYAIGDNLINYEWVQITGIKTYPALAPTLSTTSSCAFSLQDFECALFSTWNDRDFTGILIRDSADYIIWQGFITGKTFTAGLTTVFCRGLGFLLEAITFKKNYIYETGKIADVTPGAVATRLSLTDEADAAFTWDVNRWIQNANNAILITDNTKSSTSKEWDCSVITLTGGTGDTTISKTQTLRDGLNAFVFEGSSVLDAIMSCTVDGVVISDSYYLSEIRIDLKWFLSIIGSIGQSVDGYYSLQIMKNGLWQTLAGYTIRYTASTIENKNYTAEYGIGDSELGDFIIKETPVELAKYFNKDGGNNYDELQGLRFKMIGKQGVNFESFMKLDYLKITVYYDSYDISPVQHKITNNAASTIDCFGVNWDEEGVAIADTFAIGEHTLKILQDLALEMGLDIYIGTAAVTEDVVKDDLLPAGDGATTDWTPSVGGAHYLKLDEGFGGVADGEAVYVVDGDENKEEWITIEPFSMGASGQGILTALHLNTDIFTAGTPANAPLADISFDGGTTWEGEKALSMFAGERSVEWTGLSATQTQFNVLIVKFIAPAVMDADDVIQLQRFTVDIIYDKVDSILTRYMARDFWGQYGLSVLNSVCELEGVFWYEDNVNNRLVITHLDYLIAGGDSFTQADYGHEFEYQDDCNQFKHVEVYGDQALGIYWKETDPAAANISVQVKQIVDNSIRTFADAEVIAENQLAIYKDKRPSIRFTVDGTHPNSIVGVTLNLTMVRPTVAATNYIIRKKDQVRISSTLLKTTFYVGLGHTPPVEALADTIRKLAWFSHKNMTNNLIYQKG